MRSHLPLLVLLCALVELKAQSPPARGQQQGTAENPQGAPAKPAKISYWRASLPGGVFLVAINAIRSVSSHEYVLDGAARVTEVNVSTDSSTHARFYYIAPFAPSLPSGADSAAAELENRAQQAGAAAGQDPVWMKVGKTYPATTHAGTVEYRLESADQLRQLYKSVERAWLGGRSETYAAPGSKQSSAFGNKDDQADIEKSGDGQTAPN